MFRQGQLAVQGLAILLGRNEAGISNRGKLFLHHAVDIWISPGWLVAVPNLSQLNPGSADPSCAS